MSKRRSPAWLDLQLLAARIYRELQPGSVVTHDDHIRGHHSGLDRQIDVSIRVPFAGSELLVIVDTKNYGRPANVNDVGAFASLVKDVRASRGILICRSGFSSGAQSFATSHGLDLCRIHDASTRDWRLDVGIPIVWRDLLPRFEFSAMADVERYDEWSPDPSEWTVGIGPDRVEVNPGVWFEQAWNRGAVPREVGPVFGLTDPLREPRWLRVMNRGEPAWRRVLGLRFKYVVSETVYLGHVTPANARGIVHADGRFIASHVAADELPVQRDPAWPVVDSATLPIKTWGTVVTSTRWEVVPGSMRISGATAELKGQPDVIETVLPINPPGQ